MDDLQLQLLKKDEIIHHLSAELNRYIEKFGCIDSTSSVAPLPPDGAKIEVTAAEEVEITNPIADGSRLPSCDVSDDSEVSEGKAETQVALAYTIDCPAFRNKLENVEQSCNIFRIFLKNVSSAAKQYLDAGSRFCNMSTILADEIDYKKHPKAQLQKHIPHLTGDPFDVCDDFRDLLVQVGCSIEALLLNLETVLHRPFNDFVEGKLKEAAERKKAMVRAGEEYEYLLNKSLLKNRPLLPAAALSTSPQLEYTAYTELQSARSRFESARFELVQCLNEIEAKKVILIYEALTGAIHAYGSHFKRCSHIVNGFQMDAFRVAAKLRNYHERWHNEKKLWMDVRSKLKVTGSYKGIQCSPTNGNFISSKTFHEGYLFVRNPMFPGRSWKRIWFEIEGDKLYQIQTKETHRGFVCDLTLCNVRQSVTPANLPYCFEIFDNSGQNRRIFQAENGQDMNAWIQAIRSISEKQIELQLQQYCATDIEELLGQGSNQICADCGKHPADWVSINWGVMLCIECSGVHRSLGVHVSKVRSLRLDKLDATVVELVRDHLGNDRVNSIIESSLPSGWSRPLPDSAHDLKVKWINAKYKFFGFAENLKLSKEELISTLTSAAADGDILNILRCLTQGADLNSADFSESPLHIAARNGHLLCCEFLVLNNASLVTTNSLGMLPFDAAKAAGFEEVKLFLMQKMTLEQYQH